ncbi:hypothetical protein NDU88_001529 [Pleurodeles waltl]|uniref:Uncharacterized protein n=1 Tax=Pleurodeles waltl TaxID=8319 RepID=A0AAV7U7U4_PLEWA|nr:hypothetical protein NDU88_001529 [Pleurodeles waltl]
MKRWDAGPISEDQDGNQTGFHAGNPKLESTCPLLNEERGSVGAHGGRPASGAAPVEILVPGSSWEDGRSCDGLGCVGFTILARKKQQGCGF